MLRVILTRTVQTGPDSWEREHRTVDVELPSVEALMSRGDIHGAWSFQGIEVKPLLKEGA